MEFDLTKGFPMLTTRRIYPKGIIGELVGFLKGFTSAAQFREVGCNFWDGNANDNPAWLNNPNRKGVDDLGRIYPQQWRDWRGPNGESIDQVKVAIDTINNSPDSRRNIVMAWNPAEIDQMSLPCCHILFTLSADKETKELSLCMVMR